MVNNPQPPHAFHGTPGYGSSPRVAPTPVQAPGPGGMAACFVPPPAPMATLRLLVVRKQKRGQTYTYYALSLHTSIMSALGLKYGQPINLIPPTYGSVYWHLDLRDEAPCQVRWDDDQRPRVNGIDLPPGLVEEALTLHLMPGKPKYDDVYPMIADNAFTPKSK